ncbi:MAG: DUF6804 family protein [bacterium]
MKALCIISAALLFLGIPELPYGYYTFLRIAITISAGIILFSEISEGTKSWSVVFIGIAILFNPIIPIHLSKEAWIPIDAIAGVIFLVKGFNYHRQNKKESEFA